MGRSLSSWSVVRPGPVPRETQPRNARPACTVGACAKSAVPVAANAAPPAAALLFNNFLRESFFALSINFLNLKSAI
jgi:hypothetical protein